MSLPRVSSRTPLQDPTILPVYKSTTSTTASIAFALPVSYLMAVFHPRKSRHRTTFLAVLALLSLTACIYFVQSPSLALRHPDSPATDQLAVALETIRNSRLAAGAAKKHKTHKSYHHAQVRLDAGQELAAVSSFLASLPQNVIPPSVDPSVPIDPQLVLDFDTQGSRAAEEVQVMVDDVWHRNPVFLYSKVYN